MTAPLVPMPMPPPAPSPSPAEPRRTRWGSLKLRLAVLGALLIGGSVALTVALTLDSVATNDERVAQDLSLVQTRKVPEASSSTLKCVSSKFESGDNNSS